MRFKTGLCFKLSLGVAFLLFSVIYLKDNEILSNNGGEGEEISHIEIPKVQAKNVSKSQNEVAAENKGPAEPVDLVAEPSDSLAGNRIDGLPNVTEPRREKIMIGADIDSSTAKIVENISKINSEQIIYNEDLFGPVTNQTVVITVQVHNRIKYLRQLIKSFSIAPGIDNTLLIFSHDVWDENINYLIRSIDFCMAMQIFYPYSLQTHQDKFPGKSANDCPRDITKDKAIARSCINARWPDIHGHYREAQFTQTKHHWWWKANWIFNKIQATQHFSGLVLFLEEDHYVAEDFLHVLSLMETEKKTGKHKVDILSLGTYLKKTNIRTNGKQPPRYANDRKFPPNFAFRNILWQPSFLSSILGSYKQAEITEWISSKHNMGMALSRNEWNKILNCSQRFCQFDDYNWDWSLQHISHHCLKEKLQVIMVKGPRVFHIGECGVHHKKSNCDSNTGLDKVKSIITSSKNYLFPERLQFTLTALRKKIKEKKPNGGWGDKRDHELCMKFTLANDKVSNKSKKQ